MLNNSIPKFELKRLQVWKMKNPNKIQIDYKKPVSTDEVANLLGMKYNKTLFDTNNNYDDEIKEFFNQVTGKDKLAFIIEDKDGNVFGAYINSTIYGSEYQVFDINAFVFSLRSLGRYDEPKKFKIKEEYSHRAFSLKDKEDIYNMLFEVADGEIRIFKNYKNKECKCYQNAFEYNDLKRVFIAKESGGDFKLERLQVWQMK